MAKFQLPTSTKGGSKGFAPPRKTATKTAPRPKARPLAPARFESKPPPPPPTNPVGAWACLYAKKGPKKKITWLDGEVIREPYPGNMHRVRLVDADTKAQVTSTTKPASLAPFEVDKDDETCFSGYRLQITARLRGGGPAAAPAAPPAPARPAPRAPVRPAPPRPGKPRPAPAPAPAPPPPSGRAAEVGAWACLYAKKGPKKRITWIDGEVIRETYPGNQHKLKLFDAATRVMVSGATVPAAFRNFEVDDDDETAFGGYRLQITDRLRGGLAPCPAPPVRRGVPWPSLARRVDGGASMAWRRRPRHRRDASTQNPSPHRRRRRGPRHPRNKRPRGGARRRAGARRRRPWPREFVARVRIIAATRHASTRRAKLRVDGVERDTHRDKTQKNTQVPAPKPRSGPPANWASTTTVAPKQKTKRPSTKMHDGPVTDFVVLDQPRVALRGPVARKLRPHQRDAVKFLYGCLSGRQPERREGAILGDEMGLGKTLTTLALLRTLVKAAGSCQNDDHGLQKIRKACVVCPASLVAQWPNEDAKFFGRVSSNVVWIPCLEKAGGSADGTVETAKAALERWRALDGRRSCAILSISYEAFARHCESLIDADPQLDLLIMDEGHRLRGGAKAKTASLLRDCRASKRLLLTGTPAMNNLEEFHSLVDVCCPGALGDAASFRRDVMRPITQGALRGASSAQKKAKEEATQQLRSAVSAFYLRRAASDIARASLPPKTVHIVCCRMVDEQREAYEEACELRDGGALATIQKLRALATRGPARNPLHEPSSGKLRVAFAFLQHLRETGPERVVIASGSTATLDVIQACCDARRWDWLRVDGTTPPAERPRLVERFKSRTSNAFVFLLSTRAGGCGLNLVGGSRLLLLDPDWNPAHDEQAMARVWRDGQARPVHVYRLLSAGADSA